MTQPQHKPEKEKSKCASCVTVTWWGIVTLILTLIVTLSTVALTIQMSMLNNDISSQMVVLTGHRTRDWSSANSYSMHSTGEDRYTRLYVCMRSAEIINPDNPVSSSLGDYRDKARTKHDCGAESDGGWPRDYGFLRCIQANFNANFHQSNVFLKCLDLSEGIMVETIQTPASTLFLGSYNFVAMLLASLGVMAAFMLFTAGGWCTEDGLRTDMKRDGAEHPNWVPSGYNYVAAAQGWAPLAALPMWLAFAWSCFMFGTSMFYTFPAKNLWSDIVSVSGGSNTLPGTPWTGYMCSGVSLGMAAYFVSCLVEWYGDRGERLYVKEDGRRNMQNEREADSHIKNKEFQDLVRENTHNAANAANGMQMIVRPAGQNTATVQPPAFSPMPSLRPDLQFSRWDIPPPDPAAGVWGNPGNSALHLVPVQRGSYAPVNKYDPNTGRLQPQIAGVDTRFTKGFENQPHPQTLGIRYNTQLHYANHSTTHLAPLLNKAFALTWVFADSLLFVGMLNGQNSLLNENVVTIWYYIIQCRGFQLAAAYFMDDVLFRDGSVSDSEVKKSYIKNDDTPVLVEIHLPGTKSHGNLIIHAGIAVACCHLASLWCMVIVLFHFINAISIPSSLNMGEINPVSAVQIAFSIFHVCMEIVRHVIAVMTIYGRFSQTTYLTIIQAVFTLDWVFRYTFIIATLFTIPQYLGDNNAKLFSYLLP